MLEFKKIFQKKYLVTIDSRLNIGGMDSATTAEIRWLLDLRKIHSDACTFELITLDHTLTKGDSGFMEIHKLVLQMQKALNEINFSADKQGNLEIHNLEAIKKRWQSVKQETFEYNRGNTSIQELFALQDEVFENKKGIENMIKAMEFFQIYLNMYQKDKSIFSLSGNKKMVPNLFRTAEIPFNMEYFQKKLDNTFYEISFDKQTKTYNRDFLKKAYGQFPFIDVMKIEPQYEYRGVYMVNAETGAIQKAELMYREYVHEKLGGTVTYKIQSYG